MQKIWSEDETRKGGALQCCSLIPTLQMIYHYMKAIPCTLPAAEGIIVPRPLPLGGAKLGMRILWCIIDCVKKCNCDSIAIHVLSISIEIARGQSQYLYS